MFITSVLLQAVGLFLLTVAYGKYANDGVGSVGLKTLGNKYIITAFLYGNVNVSLIGSFHRTDVRGHIGNLLHFDADIAGQRLHSDAG
jgi:hypothetical protein